jgi:outer membrane immunogenic protein
MDRLILSVAFLVAAVAIRPASAADLEGEAITAENAPAVWQGLYAGVTVGADNAGFLVAREGEDAQLTQSSVGAGAFAGYNFGDGPFVWGVEADIGSIGFDDEKKSVDSLGDLSRDGTYVGSLRLRGGYAWDAVLLYATGGVAFTDLELKTSAGGTSDLSVGAVVGLGAEVAFADNWTARAEGLLYAFGDDDAEFAGERREIGAGVSTLRVGIVRKF